MQKKVSLLTGLLKGLLPGLAFLAAILFMPSGALGSDYEVITSRTVPEPDAVLSGELEKPALVNVGVAACPPCRRMAGDLLELQANYDSIFETHYYDMHKHSGITEKLDIRMVPTQIFLDKEGEELYRHEGYLSRKHILETWADLGYDVQIVVPSRGVRDYLSLDYIFSRLSLAVQGAPLTAMAAAFVWGILSVILSPCHLASIPLIIGYINRRKVETAARATVLSLMFALGILICIMIVGIITAMAGRLLGDLGSLPYYLVAIVLLLFGLNLAGLLQLHWSLVDRLVPKDSSKKGAVFLGLVIGVGLGPCTFVFMAPMLGLTLSLASAEQVFGLLLLGIFALAHCMLLVAAGVSPGFLYFFLRWNELSPGSSVLRKTCGVLLILGGIYLFYYAL